MNFFSKSTVAVMLCSLLFISCSKSDEDYNGSGGSGANTTNPFAKKLVGTYTRTSSYSEPYYYYYLGDGNGYQEQAQSNNGIYRQVFTWTMDGDKLTIIYDGDEYYTTSEYSYIVSFDSEGNLTLLDSKNQSTIYTKINNNATTNVKFKEPPFASYIRIYGAYYELSRASMSSDHGTGTGANFKHLMFFGTNDLMQPIGARFMYSTPYYEGIDKYWSEGSYNINSDSGYWIYGGTYCYRNSWSSRCDGKLKIKKTNNIMVFDFNLDDGDAIGHFVGTVQ